MDGIQLYELYDERDLDQALYPGLQLYARHTHVNAVYAWQHIAHVHTR